LYKKTRRRKMAQLSAPRAATRKIVIRSREWCEYILQFDLK
jgi:hypothetical protein